MTEKSAEDSSKDKSLTQNNLIEKGLGDLRNQSKMKHELEITQDDENQREESGLEILKKRVITMSKTTSMTEEQHGIRVAAKRSFRRSIREDDGRTEAEGPRRD